MSQTLPNPAEPRGVGPLPPGPTAPWWGLPLLRRMQADYLGFTGGLRRDYGDVTYMRLGWERAWDVFDPELVRAVLVDEADHLVRWERGIEVLEQVFGQSVLVTEGESWRRQRRMLQAAFTPAKVAGYAALMRDAARSGLDAALPAGAAEGVVAMDPLFARLAMDVILRTLFSRPAADDAAAAADAVQLLSETAMREMFQPFTLPDWLPLPGKAAKRRAIRTLKSLVRGHIDARRDAPAQPDLLGMLLALRDVEGGGALSPAEVFDQCMVSFQAGHETTATALLWWSALIAEHPEAAARARAEVDALGGDPGPEHLVALPWLTATLKEAMRLYPPVAALMTRRTTAPIAIGPWPLPRGAVIRITPAIIQRDPRWFERPDEFVPERFMPGAPVIPRGAWMPFGAGPRVCLGQHFALLEMTLIAAMLLQRYTLEGPLDAGWRVADVNVTLRPRRPVRLRLRRRGDQPAVGPAGR